MIRNPRSDGDDVDIRSAGKINPVIVAPDAVGARRFIGRVPCAGGDGDSAPVPIVLKRWYVGFSSPTRFRVRSITPTLSALIAFLLDQKPLRTDGYGSVLEIGTAGDGVPGIGFRTHVLELRAQLVERIAADQ